MSSHSKWNPDRAVLVGLMVAAIVYLRDLRYDFILDDVALILMNQTPPSWTSVKSAFTSHIFSGPSSDIPLAITAVHYRPVYVLWQMLNRVLFGTVFPWWHLTSLLLHLGVVLLVYVVGSRLLKSRWTAALAAVLFALHPIHAEAVAYVTASTDLLVTLFTLAALFFCVRFRDGARLRANLTMALLAAALATLSKESGVVLPLLLVAYEATREPRPNDQPSWRRYLWTAPFFAVAAAYVATRTLLFGLNSGPGPGGNRIWAVRDSPLVGLLYLRNLLWPFRLSFFYPVEWTSNWTLIRTAAITAFAIAAILLWRRSRGHADIRLPLVWMAILFAIPLSGVVTFVREDWVHDRHMYLPSVALCWTLAALLAKVRLPAKSSIVLSTAVLVLLAGDTALQVSRFRDGETVYASALEVDPNGLQTRINYAWALWGDGRHDEALRQFQIATELSPRSAVTHENYGAVLAESGRDEEARRELQSALRWLAEPTPLRSYVLYELAAIEVKRSASGQAADELQEAIRISPRAANYHALLAQALRQQGRIEEADEQMRTETELRREQLQHPARRQ